MTPATHMPFLAGWKALLGATVLSACGASGAAELEVRISGLAEPLGQVGCALYAAATGFPMDNTTARVLWLPASAKALVCRFAALPEGSYAVSVGHDLNGNKRIDTNLIGLPTEQWGVSNNVRPRLRAPRFDEALFKLAAGPEEVVIDIQVAK
jgi:uncharacterized protein (DUF2141 family)